MIKKVSIKAIETKSWLGGCCPVPSAVLRNENTTKSLKKLVIKSISDGAKTRRVKTTKTFSEVTNSFGVLGADKDRFIVGSCTAVSAEYSAIAMLKSKSKALITFSLKFFVV